MGRYAFMVEREIEVEAESEDEARDLALEILYEGNFAFDVYLSYSDEEDEDEE